MKKTLTLGDSGVEHLILKGSPTPGFKTLQVTTEVDGKEYTNLIKIAFSPDKLAPTTPLPKDFTRYWDKCIAKAREVPLEPKFTRRPQYDNAFADVYEVRFENAAKGCYLYGMLAVPKGVCPTDTVATRQYPAVILWPGAGVKAHRGDVNFFPEHGVITLEMGIHGIPVSYDDDIYADLRANALNKYSAILSPDRNRYYYNKVYVGTVKTVDLLCTLPCVDAGRIGCYGGSQGGALSTINAALDARIRCAAISYPALSEIGGYARGRADGWPHLFRVDEVGETEEALLQVADYYDVINFARQIKTCKVLFFLGFNDVVCCPTSTYTAWNALPRENKHKQLVLMQESGHWMHADYQHDRREWLLEQLTK